MRDTWRGHLWVTGHQDTLWGPYLTSAGTVSKYYAAQFWILSSYINRFALLHFTPCMWGNFHIFSYIYLDKTKPKVLIFGGGDPPPCMQTMLYFYNPFQECVQGTRRICSEVGTMWLHTSRVETLQPMLWMMRHFSSSLPFQHSNILNCIEKVNGRTWLQSESFLDLGCGTCKLFSFPDSYHTWFVSPLSCIIMFKK